jgi:hypothetical protein
MGCISGRYGIGCRTLLIPELHRLLAQIILVECNIVSKYRACGLLMGILLSAHILIISVK